MISNEFIHETSEKFDVEYLSNFLNKLRDNRGLLAHQHLVEQDPYMSSIREKFPFLSSVFNVYNLYPGVAMTIHIDAKRFGALNIPISGTENSSTIFYKMIGEPDLELFEEKYYTVKSPVEEVFRFTLTKPTLMNNSVPHSVHHNGSRNRIIISWSLMKEYKFEEVKEYFLNSP